MNRFKKLSIVFIMVMLITCIATSKTYAILNCNINLSTSKNKATYEEQFSVYATISNLQTTNGIIAIGAVVSYDTDSLTLVDIEGQNKWSDPFHNPSNGKITLFKNELSTKNENVFKITFKVNEKGKAKSSAWVKLSDFEISDGEEEKNCGGSSINIKIEDQDSTNTGNSNQGNNNQGNNNQGNSNQGNNNQGSSNQGSNSQTSNNTKKTGDNQTTKPSTETTKPEGNGSTNETTVENINTNNVDTNSIENVEREDSTNNESETNNVQNVFEDNVEESKENKTMNKGLFYIISVIAVIAIIVILFVIVKCWRTKK